MNSQEREEFQQQLHESAVSVVNTFLTDPIYDVTRSEYAIHFDEIKSIINAYRPKFRICAEDIGALSPVIKTAISENFLFFQELHRAISEGILSKEKFN